MSQSGEEEEEEEEEKEGLFRAVIEEEEEEGEDQEEYEKEVDDEDEDGEEDLKSGRAVSKRRRTITSDSDSESEDDDKPLIVPDTPPPKRQKADNDGDGGELEAVQRERDEAIRQRDKAIREKDEAVRERDAVIWRKDADIRDSVAQIAELRQQVHAVEVFDVEQGVAHVVERAGTEPPLERMRQDKAASAGVIGALQGRLVKVKQECEEKRVHHESELRASVDAASKEARSSALDQVAEALGCAVCFEPLAPGAVAFQCGHTYCNRQSCGSSTVTTCPECRQTVTSRLRLFGALVNVSDLLLENT